MAQITFNLKLHILGGITIARGIVGDRIPQFTAKLFIHHVVTQVRDVTNHARNAQAALGHHAVLVKVAAMKIRIGHDGAACHLVEGDVFSGEVGGACHHHRMCHTGGVTQGPRQSLHATQTAAHDGR